MQLFVRGNEIKAVEADQFQSVSQLKVIQQQKKNCETKFGRRTINVFFVINFRQLLLKHSMLKMHHK
jgi:hypothetical protein